jgi:hypothetical protein
VASVAGTWRSVGIVSQEEVVFGILGVLAGWVGEHVGRRELVKGKKHVVNHRVADSCLGEGQVMGVAQLASLYVVGPCAVDGRGILEEGALRCVVCIEGAHGGARFEGPRRCGGRGRPWLVVGEVVHGGHRSATNGVDAPLVVHGLGLEQAPRWLARAQWVHASN